MTKLYLKDFDAIGPGLDTGLFLKFQLVLALPRTE